MTDSSLAPPSSHAAALGDDQLRLTRSMELFWHPVCTVEELTRPAPASHDGVRPLAVRLLGRDLVIAEVADHGVIALDDRCLHRSTKLSVGWVDTGGIRCAYHGWLWDGSGKCIDIPSMPDGPIPSRARVGAYSTQVAYGLVWVRIDDRAATSIPACPAFDDPGLRVLTGAPYTWPTAAPRRVENFVDLAHFAWVHAGTLGRRDEPVPPLPELTRVDGELRFTYDPPEFDPESTAMYGISRYRMPMPCTVSIEFTLESGARRLLWMTASPIDAVSCRSFWFIARDDDLDGDDEPHFAFQRIVLDEDEPVVTNQVPAWFPLDTTTELSVRTDKVSIEYRRWLREIAEAGDPNHVAEVLGQRPRTPASASPQEIRVPRRSNTWS